MSQTPIPLHGVLHGRTIELSEEPGLPEGAVVVRVEAASVKQPKIAPGEGLQRAFGAWAEDGAELDEYLAWNRQQRKASRSPLED